MDKLEINYDRLVEKALKHVVIEALRIAADEGLPGEHHFYITFKTTHPGVRVSAQLLNQYPEEMTIVIQHQYSNLYVEADRFSVDLSFGGVLQTLSIPFAAITYFADPHAKFGLSFSIDDTPSSGSNKSFTEIEEESPAPKTAGGSATVVSIDSFRRKK